MKRALRIGLGLLAGLVVVLAGFYTWASITSNRLLGRTIATHTVDFPIPFPPDEPVASGNPAEDGVDRDMEAAVARGRHLVEARYACTECHGDDFGGGVMVDDPLVAVALGPNLTTGRGSRTLDYGPADWDRAVRHGLRKDGTPSAMPAEDFQLMSDQELSDVVAYIRSVPPVDNEVPSTRIGPLGRVLMATGALPLSADLIDSHTSPHSLLPPEAEVSAEFGRHLAGVCIGCHRANLTGGPIAAGDPSWPPARNITPHEDGLAGWSYEDFVTALTLGTRPDGSDIREPMTLVLPYARNMTEVEMRALWAYVRSVPPLPTEE